MADKFNVRWAFNVSSWKPTEDQILAASKYIQKEEKDRILRYVFLDDAKSTLIGRLMLRKYIHISTLIPYNEIKLGRDDKGKPILLGVGDAPVNFNISHQGDFVVLAGNTKNIGIDIMKIESPANKDVKEFFRLMKRQFSDHEWATIYRCPTERDQIANFYRFWCLKESYVKNLGVGITIPLVDISFSIKTLKLKVGEVVNDTVLYVRDQLKHDWVFEETLVDDKHTVAVSYQNDKEMKSLVSYKFLTFEDLVREAKPLSYPEYECYTFRDTFMKKPLKQI